MFENPLPVMKNDLKHTHIHTQKQVCVATKLFLRHLLSVYVCFKTLFFVMKMKHHRSNVNSHFYKKSYFRSQLSVYVCLKSLCFIDVG